MTSTALPPTGVRTPWQALPVAARDAVAEVLGEPVVEAVTQSGNFRGWRRMIDQVTG